MVRRPAGGAIGLGRPDSADGRSRKSGEPALVSAAPGAAHRRTVKGTAAALGGVAVALGFAPFGWWPLVLVGSAMP